MYFQPVSNKKKDSGEKILDNNIFNKNNFTNTFLRNDKIDLSQNYDNVINNQHYEINNVPTGFNNNPQTLLLNENRRNINIKNISFYNLTIREIMINIILTILTIWNDLRNTYNQTQSLTINQVLEIIMIENRPVYLGLALIFLSFIMYFIFITS